MLKEPRLRRQGGIRALVASIVAIGAVTGCVALHKASAADTEQKQNAAARPPLTTAQVSARTAPHASRSSGCGPVADQTKSGTPIDAR